jgi:hypothetical protein
VVLMDVILPMHLTKHMYYVHIILVWFLLLAQVWTCYQLIFPFKTNFCNLIKYPMTKIT